MAEFSRRGFLTVMGAAGVGGAVGLPAEAQGVRRPAGPDFDLIDASVSGIHHAMRTGRLTCRQLVQAYLDRIAAYDQHGPALNAFLHVNPEALSVAEEMDRTFARGGFRGPLHGIPVVLKDNHDTADMPTTAGSASMAGARPGEDATVVARLRKAGALIIGKANMQEFALGGVTISSLGGQTKNPYDLTLTPGGSSGGTAAALAADFATVGTGSDTANSIRSPASANNLVGFRPTKGLVSTAGIVPVSFTQDEAGPITRSVADAAIMLDVMAGPDARDAATALAARHVPRTYTAYLDRNGLRRARLGVLRTLFGQAPENAEVNRVMDQAIEAIKRQGAVVIEVGDPALDTTKLSSDLDVQEYEYKSVINAYLQAPAEHAPVHSLADIIASGKYTPSLGGFLTAAQAYADGLHEPDYKTRLAGIEALKRRVADLMAHYRLDALVYPHQKILPVPIGQTNQAQRNGILGALAGLPAITLPAGFSSPTSSAPIGVPVGIEFLGRPWSEPSLFRLAYGFEQATKAKRSPVSTPPLDGR
jgi:Asp-tRNA(Asn)/Glu-tRNA(Gln) amidotransferase A subunit family amidase